jgi:Flp pilus assembly secretin CpaC
VIPCVLSDGFTINLTLIPTLMQFSGYDNPNGVANSGLQTSGAFPGGLVQIPTVLPHFTVRQVVSTVNVWDGQTVVLGGLLSENVTTIKDQVPVLGDIPLLGVLFRSESKTTQPDDFCHSQPHRPSRQPAAYGGRDAVCAERHSSATRAAGAGSATLGGGQSGK